MYIYTAVYFVLLLLADKCNQIALKKFNSFYQNNESLG